MIDLVDEQYMKNLHNNDHAVNGSYISKDGDRYYLIENVDQMKPFFMSVVSDRDHWLFISSTGGLTAGRVSPETALFTYKTVDNIHDDYLKTGTRTIVRISAEDGGFIYWEPFNQQQAHRYETTRNLYKNTLGNKLCFEEINHTLGLVYEYTWCTSDEYGFVRRCKLKNLWKKTRQIELLDGFKNVLPAGTPRFTQTNSSYLVDAYKCTELHQESGLGMFTLYSGITDRAEPCEALTANTVFCNGFKRDHMKVLLSSEQLPSFKRGASILEETVKAGVRGCYMIYTKFKLHADSDKDWSFVANVERTQGQLVALIDKLENDTRENIDHELKVSVENGCDQLARMMAGADGLQTTEEECVSVHHYANVLFNVMRGGTFEQQYQVGKKDFCKTIAFFNHSTYENNKAFLEQLPERIDISELIEKVEALGDEQLLRLTQEYLPITFGRRHGDPSRPWNQFEIKLNDENGDKLLSYQGNWRDIFQNWEALLLSYPSFIESTIAKFVNASTVDGFNPYRITKEGIDWEVEDPADPWSYIGYWGDHQIIYLQKLLELSHGFQPNKLSTLLRRNMFSYANVPYRIKSYEDIKYDPQNTVEYDDKLADLVEERVKSMGADGKLILDHSGKVYQVNLLEKILVCLLAKLSNLVVGGGIWLNTQRPEWNDANNALVGHGLSMVTLYYVRRYLSFLKNLLKDETGDIQLSLEVSEWLEATLTNLTKAAKTIENGSFSESDNHALLTSLGRHFSHYRAIVYQQHGFSEQINQPIDSIKRLIDVSLVAVDYTIDDGKDEDGLYHAYNILNMNDHSVSVDYLYPMLEGQVAALSSGYLSAEESVNVLKALFDSEIYRPDQESFMLYPNKPPTPFLGKNTLAKDKVDKSKLLKKLLVDGNKQVVELDAKGQVRFNSLFKNRADLVAALEKLPQEYSALVNKEQASVMALYEHTFAHKAFTGRSGGMFGFEGLGSIYWHMVSKLLLAVQETIFHAIDNKEDSTLIKQLSDYYYKVRKGMGFNKSPDVYGAFPTDPYSHTPKHSGAQQPGMTGQVKEEVLTRLGEFGIRVKSGKVSVTPKLLRKCEFVTSRTEFRFLDVDERWDLIDLSPGSLGMTWCQVPVVFHLDLKPHSELAVVFNNGKEVVSTDLTIDETSATHIFNRDGAVKQINVFVRTQDLYDSL